MQEGTATFTAGDETVEVKGGQVVVVPATVAHKFDRPLVVMDASASPPLPWYPSRVLSSAEARPVE